MVKFKYRICPECFRILDMDFKNPTGPIFLTDLYGRSSKSISSVCYDCEQKIKEREELTNALRSTIPFMDIDKNILIQAKNILKNRHK